MASFAWPEKQIKIQHRFDQSLEADPSLLSLAKMAAAFVDQDCENESDATITWAAQTVVAVAESGNPPRRVEAKEGPLLAKLVDADLGVEHGAYFSLKELDEDNYRYYLLRMWNHFLMKRTARLHRLVFDPAGAGEAK